jgi:AraC-like DNA-binding protein
MFRCAYAGKINGPRYEQWREQWARRWLSADFDSIGEPIIDNEIRATEHAFLGLCNMRSTPVRIERRNDRVHNVGGTRFLVVAAGSKLHAHQRGRSLDLAPGQMVLLSVDEPAQLLHLTGGDRWSIRVSQKLLGEICRNVDDKLAQPIGASSELTRLLLQQLETAQLFASELDAAANYTMAQHIFDLMALCIRADVDATHLAQHRGLAAARFNAIKDDILSNLAQPGLGLAQVAANNRLSTRYIQHLFEQSGTSFTGFVLEQRLLLAHRLLREPKSRRRKISDIAAAAGFSDVSYFNRAFKARFGTTPSDVRNSVVAGV